MESESRKMFKKKCGKTNVYFIFYYIPNVINFLQNTYTSEEYLMKLNAVMKNSWKVKVG